MTFQPPDKQEPPKGPGCGDCALVGFGPAMVPRCRHPERPCWCGPVDWLARGDLSVWAGWAIGCSDHQPRGYRPPDPQPVPLADHCEAVAEGRRPERLAKAA